MGYEKPEAKNCPVCGNRSQHIDIADGLLEGPEDEIIVLFSVLSPEEEFSAIATCLPPFLLLISTLLANFEFPVDSFLTTRKQDHKI